MSDIGHDFLRLFGFSGLVSFVAGVLCTLLCFWVGDRIRDHRYPQNAPHRTAFRSLLLLWMMVYVIIGYIAVQFQNQQNDLRSLADHVRQCNQEFLRVSKIRQDAGDQTDEWSRIKTKAMNDWLKEVIVDPPADMLARRQANPNDPVYIQWAIDTTVRYELIIGNAEDQQEQSLAERRAHPLPEPKCGS